MEGVNQYGFKTLRTFDIVIGLSSKQEAEAYLLQWLSEQAPDFDAQRLRADTAELDRDTYARVAQACADDCSRLKQKLDAAEQRIAQTVAKLELAVSMLDDDERGNRFAQVLQIAIAALNPKPEAGSHEVAREALKMENQRITPARFKCLACGDYHEGSGNLPCPKMLPNSITLTVESYKKRED